MSSTVALDNRDSTLNTQFDIFWQAKSVFNVGVRIDLAVDFHF